jgi:hypothetical protein
MKLTDLEPRWLHPNLFIFRCQHCRRDLLSCKNVAMSQREQWQLFEKAIGEDWNALVVPCRDDMAWVISSQDFATMSVTPSLDASASGHWHGFITNGEIR